MRYNKAVQEFNVSIRIFPNSLTNSLFLHLQPKEPFKAEAGAEKGAQGEILKQGGPKGAGNGE